MLGRWVLICACRVWLILGSDYEALHQTCPEPPHPNPICTILIGSWQLWIERDGERSEWVSPLPSVRPPINRTTWITLVWYDVLPKERNWKRPPPEEWIVSMAGDDRLILLPPDAWEIAVPAVPLLYRRTE